MITRLQVILNSCMLVLNLLLLVSIFLLSRVHLTCKLVRVIPQTHLYVKKFPSLDTLVQLYPLVVSSLLWLRSSALIVPPNSKSLKTRSCMSLGATLKETL